MYMNYRCITFYRHIMSVMVFISLVSFEHSPGLKKWCVTAQHKNKRFIQLEMAQFVRWLISTKHENNKKKKKTCTDLRILACTDRHFFSFKRCPTVYYYSSWSKQRQRQQYIKFDRTYSCGLFFNVKNFGSIKMRFVSTLLCHNNITMISIQL